MAGKSRYSNHPSKDYDVVVLDARDPSRGLAIAKEADLVPVLSEVNYSDPRFEKRNVALNSFAEPHLSYPFDGNFLAGVIADPNYEGNGSLNGPYHASRDRFREKVLDQIKKGRQPLVFTYSATKNTEKLGIPVTGSKLSVRDTHEKKTLAYLDAQRLGIPVAPGAVVESKAEAKKVFSRLKSEYGSAFVSSATGSAGDSALQVHSLEELARFPEKALVTGWVEKYASPTASFFVGNDRVIYLGMADQLIDGVKYGSTVFPSNVSPEVQSRIKEDVLRAAEDLRTRIGYRGFANMDFMVPEWDHSQYFFTGDRNMRLFGSSGSWLGYLSSLLPDEHPSFLDLEIFNLEGKDLPSDIVTDFDELTKNSPVCWGRSVVKAKGPGMIVKDLVPEYSYDTIFKEYNGKTRSSVVNPMTSGTFLYPFSESHILGGSISVGPSREEVLKGLKREEIKLKASFSSTNEG